MLPTRLKARVPRVGIPVGLPAGERRLEDDGLKFRWVGELRGDAVVGIEAARDGAIRRGGRSYGAETVMEGLVSGSEALKTGALKESVESILRGSRAISSGNARIK